MLSAASASMLSNSGHLAPRVLTYLLQLQRCALLPFSLRRVGDLALCGAPSCSDATLFVLAKSYNCLLPPATQLIGKCCKQVLFYPTSNEMIIFTVNCTFTYCPEAGQEYDFTIKHDNMMSRRKKIINKYSKQVEVKLQWCRPGALLQPHHNA